MKRFAEQRPFLFFYTLALVIFTGGLGIAIVYMPDFLELFAAKMEELGSNHSNIFITILLMFDNPLFILGFIIPGAPAIAAIVTTKLTGKPGAVKKLFGKFKPAGDGITSKEALTQYSLLLAYGIIVIVIGLAYSAIAYGESGLQQCLTNLRASSPLLMVVLFFLACFTEEGALLEELGWRGYALPLLMKRLKTPLHAAVMLGIAWSFWHFARNVMPLFQGMPLWDWILTEINFLTGCIASTIVIVYFVNRLSGSIIPAIFLHGLGNYSFNYIAGENPVFLEFNFDTILRIIGAIIIIIIAGSQLGLRKMTPNRLQVRGESHG